MCVCVRVCVRVCVGGEYFISSHHSLDLNDLLFQIIHIILFYFLVTKALFDHWLCLMGT